MTTSIERRGVLGMLAGSLATPLLASAGKPAASIAEEPRTVASGLHFPEGIVTTRDGGLLFVEIAAGRLSRMAPDGRVSALAMPNGGPNGTTIGADGAIYLANNGGLRFDHVGERWSVAGVPDDFAGGSIQRVDPATGAVTTLYRDCAGHRLCGPNDILCDAWGGLWFSDTGKIYARTRDQGGLYWCAPDGSAIREIAYPLNTPNGIALSPDRRTLYVALSDKRQIVAYALTGPGTVEQLNGRPHARVVASPAGDLSFDNIAVEAGGNIVATGVRAGVLLTITPAGEVIETVKLPDPIVTAIAFGGPDMRTLYATLSGSGRIVALRWPRPGLPPLHRL
jgi:gluconolactonase